MAELAVEAGHGGGDFGEGVVGDVVVAGGGLFEVTGAGHMVGVDEGFLDGEAAEAVVDGGELFDEGLLDGAMGTGIAAELVVEGSEGVGVFELAEDGEGAVEAVVDGVDAAGALALVGVLAAG